MAGSGQRVKEEPGLDVMDYGIVKKEVELIDEEMQGLKEEPEYADSADTSEAALAGLYADHVVKDELVLVPERPHRPVVSLVVRERCETTSHYKSGGTASAPLLADETTPRLKHPDTQHESNYVSDCGKIFQLKHNLTKHIKSQHLICSSIYEPSKPYVCDICQKAYTCLSKLKAHIRIHTGERPYSCKVCKKTFTLSSSLERHHRIHTGEKPYHCGICKLQFRDWYTLKKHKLIHTGEKPYHCEVCQMQFRNKYNLQTHELIHTGEKPYQCDICEMQFRNRFTLKIHKLIHTGEKPHQCEVCNKQFRDPSSLRRHKLIHTGEKPYQCEICKKLFRASSTLRRHKRCKKGISTME